MRWHCIPDRMTVEVFGYHFFVFQAIFSNFQSFFQPGSLNGAVRSDPTPLHNEAIFTKSGKIKVSLYSKSLFFELDTQNFGSSIVLESPWIYTSQFLSQLTIYYMKITWQVKWRYHYPPKFVFWLDSNIFDFSIVLSHQVDFYLALWFITWKSQNQVKWTCHYKAILEPKFHYLTQIQRFAL